MKVRAILLDIEGTTSSIDFVHEVLFPYAARELPAYVRNHAADREVAALLDEARAEAQVPDASVEELVGILGRWIKEDRKAGSLKALQGRVWQKGYADGDFRGHIFPDAASNMRKWVAKGIALYIYSSGSVQAQELLFGHSEAGDLRPLISSYFDTRIGHKREASSYRAIVEALHLPPEQILFLSDIAAELDAAAKIGVRTLQLVRDNRVVVGKHATVADFDSIAVSSGSPD